MWDAAIVAAAWWALGRWGGEAVQPLKVGGPGWGGVRSTWGAWVWGSRQYSGKATEAPSFERRARPPCLAGQALLHARWRPAGAGNPGLGTLALPAAPHRSQSNSGNVRA